MDKINVLMKEDEVASFTEFRKHQNNFTILTNSKVLDINTGKITLHMSNGKIKKVVIEKTIVQN